MHILQDVRIFEGLTNDELNRLMAISFPLEFGPNEFVFKRGSLGHQLYVILKGRVQIFADDPKDTARSVTLSMLSENDVFGEFTIFDGLPRSASALTLSPVSVLEFHRADLLEIFEENKNIGLKVMMNMGELLTMRLRMADDELLRMA